MGAPPEEAPWAGGWEGVRRYLADRALASEEAILAGAPMKRVVPGIGTVA